MSRPAIPEWLRPYHKTPTWVHPPLPPNPRDHSGIVTGPHTSTKKNKGILIPAPQTRFSHEQFGVPTWLRPPTDYNRFEQDGNNIITSNTVERDLCLQQTNIDGLLASDNLNFLYETSDVDDSSEALSSIEIHSTTIRRGDQSIELHTSKLFHVVHQDSGTISIYAPDEDIQPAAVIRRRTALLLDKYVKNGFYLNSNGYLCGRVRAEGTIHEIVMNSDITAKSLAATYWCVKEKELHIAHLNSNRMDPNIENLMWLPQQLNYYMRFNYPVMRNNGTFYAIASFQGKTYGVNDIKSFEKCSVIIDSIKIRLVRDHFATNPDLCSKWINFLLKHAVHRPHGYHECYKSMDELLKVTEGRFVTYALGTRPPTAMLQCFSTLEEAIEDATDLRPLRNIQEATIRTPLLSDDVIVRYTGARGKVIWFIVDKPYFRHLVRIRPTVTTNRGGYVLIFKRSEQIRVSMHIDIMKRRLINDGRVIDHGNNCTGDNRRRNLSVQTYSQNNRNVKNAKGVYKHWKKWRIHIQINKKPWRVPMNTKMEGMCGYRHLTSNIEDVERMVVKDNMRAKDLSIWLEKKLRDGRLLDGLIESKEQEDNH